MGHPCEYNARAEFWDDLQEIRHWWAGPICFAGDFNAVRSYDETNKIEADGRNSGFLNIFILQQESVDQSLVGGAYTWSNNQTDPLLCRLVRFLFSVEFDEAFPSALQISLTRTVSDRNPLMVITSHSLSSKPYFKLEKSWTEHEDFEKKVAIWWNAMHYSGSASSVFFLKLKNLKYFIYSWGLIEFGAVGRDKRILTEKIGEFNLRSLKKGCITS
ncbi:uncharacterized protein LOC113294174 [Papaver somniferum]|uniref:uncharacterized protein LOC113294174 n=1 Tax=Papaver somniferum TaxID=3469 RepID=UPI000E7058C6|nr:uncharacterized protein LOC113294174 [Papaver somniferum]